MSAASLWFRMLAEAHAFPFASHSSFDWGLDHLSRAPDYVFGQDTAKLHNALRFELQDMAEQHSIESLDTLTSFAWFGRLDGIETRDDGAEEVITVRLDRLLRKLAERFLRFNGSEIVLVTEDADAPDASKAAQIGAIAEEWRWLTLRMPTDLLVAALRVSTPNPDGAWMVDLASPALSQLLRGEDGRVAQTHLHLGAALSTSTLWSGLAATQRFSRWSIDPSRIDTRWRLPFETPEAFVSMLLVACVARLWLAQYLARVLDAEGEIPTFSEWLDDVLLSVDGSSGDDVERAALSSEIRDRERAEAVRRAILGGPAALKTVTWRDVRWVYQQATRDMPDSVAVRPPGIVHDPLEELMVPRRQAVPVEAFFAREALRFLDSSQPKARPYDKAFATMFWQYQRVRALFHRFLTQEPGSMGLDWFSVFQQRLGLFTWAIDSVLPALAIEAESARLELHSFEARLVPPATAESIRNTVLWFVQALCPRGAPTDEFGSRSATARMLRECPPNNLPERALVVHFTRDKPRPHPLSPARERCLEHYRGWYREQRRRANALETALRDHPELLLILRGVDIANLEYAIPTWVFAPIMKSVRAVSIETAQRLHKRRPEWKVRPMGTTAHAGEDYRRLVDALRRVHELIEYKVLDVGDRIGHGLALGIDARSMCDRYPVVPQPRIERLEDLLWELDCYERRLLPDRGRYHYVRKQIREHSCAIYDRDIPIEVLLSARQLLGSNIVQQFLGNPNSMGLLDNAVGAERAAIEVLDRYLSDGGVCLRGCEPVPVRADESEVAMLDDAQSMLRRELAAMDVTVEANPSSNLLVGALGSIRSHPVLSLAPVVGLAPPPGADRAPLRVSLNSDDPTTFATCLADEYAHMYLALIHEGVTAKHALQWLRDVRDNGWNSRFSLPASARPDVLADLIEALDVRVAMS